jgi:hypothetical protein
MAEVDNQGDAVGATEIPPENVTLLSQVAFSIPCSESCCNELRKTMN